VEVGVPERGGTVSNARVRTTAGRAGEVGRTARAGGCDGVAGRDMGLLGGFGGRVAGGVDVLGCTVVRRS